MAGFIIRAPYNVQTRFSRRFKSFVSKYINSIKSGTICFIDAVCLFFTYFFIFYEFFPLLMLNVVMY